nr:hypothetical protein [Tanacetum cinerariifolium]
ARPIGLRDCAMWAWEQGNMGCWGKVNGTVLVGWRCTVSFFLMGCWNRFVHTFGFSSTNRSKINKKRTKSEQNWTKIGGEEKPGNNYDGDGDAAFDGKKHDFDAKKPESDVILSPSSSAQSRKQYDKTKKEAKGKSHVEPFT